MINIPCNYLSTVTKELKLKVVGNVNQKLKLFISIYSSR